MSNTKYTVDYFIKKFERVPEEKWCTGSYLDDEGRSCALGHCGYTYEGQRWIYARSEEGEALTSLFLETLYLSVVSINDAVEKGVLGDTPQERVLIQLYNIKGYLS